MGENRVIEIERAIGELTPQELEELRLWLDDYAGPTPLDQRIAADVASGKLDKLIQSAVDDERNGRTRPL